MKRNKSQFDKVERYLRAAYRQKRLRKWKKPWLKKPNWLKNKLLKIFFKKAKVDDYLHPTLYTNEHQSTLLTFKINNHEKA